MQNKMRDWRNCKDLPHKKVKMNVEGKDYIMTKYNFNYCLKCPVNKCRGKILIRAENRAMGAIGKR